MSRPSTIDRLPDEVRDKLHAWLRDPGITQTEATARINALLDELAIDHPPVSRHAVNRYDLRMREVGKTLVQTRQVADAWVAKLGSRPGGRLGHLVVEMLRTLVFEVTLKLQGAELTSESLPGVTAQLRALSLAAQRLERASAESERRESEIRRRAAEEAADTAKKSLKRRGLSDQVVEEIQSEILGI